MDLRLDGQIALVVGGHGLLGRAIVERLRAERATVVPASRHAPDGLVMDAADDESIASGLARIHEEHGRLDVLVVAAAPSARTLDPARNSDPEQVLEAFAAKTLTFLRLANAVIPDMVDAGHGRVVGISGQNAFQTGNVTGSIRNAAVVIAAKNLADSVAGSGVTVNAVSPGIVVEQASADIAIGRSGQCTPQQVADLVAFLASPLAATVSGESIAVGHRVRGATGL